MKSSLENTISLKARELLVYLEELSNDVLGEVEEGDIASAADYIYSIVDVKDVKDSGMSEQLESELSQVKVRTMRLLSSRVQKT